MTNDQLIEKLNNLMKFAYKVPDKAIKIVSVIVNTKKKIKPKPLGKFGPHVIYGKAYDDVLHTAMEVLQKVRYLKTKETLKLLFAVTEKFEGSPTSEARKTMEYLSKYDFNALKQIGYRPQEVVLEFIKSFKNEDIKEHLEDLLLIIGCILKPSFEGTSMQDYKTMTFHSGPLNANERLISIRKEAISFLEKMYSIIETSEKKKKVIETLEEATRRPSNHSYGEDMIDMITSDTNTVIDFYIEIIDKADNVVVKTIEERKNWFLRWTKKESLPRIEELESKIATKSDYGMFKIFVGHDHEFSKELDWDKAKNQRLEKIKEFISSMSMSNIKEWKKKVFKVVSHYSSDKYSEFQYFNIFLFELAKAKPEIGFEFIKLEKLSPFMVNLIAGLWKSPKKNDLIKILKKWIGAGKNLPSISFLFSYVEEVDIDLINLVVSKAKATKDFISLTNIVDSITRNYGKDGRLKKILIEVIYELSCKLKNDRWLNHIWFKSEQILKDFTPAELDKILESLLITININYDAESMLTFIADSYPEKVIHFFEKRVAIKTLKNRKYKEDDRYDAIPYDFRKLAESLSKHEKEVIPMVFKWYELGSEKENWLYRWEASNLISNIFPQLNPTLKKELFKLIKKKDKKSLEIVYSLLGKYEGEEFLYEIVEEIMKTYKKDGELKNIKSQLFGYLSQTGVVTGEYGFVDALTKKKENIEKYTVDRSKEFQDFTKEYVFNLEKSIEYQKKRADEDIALRQSGLE